MRPTALDRHRQTVAWLIEALKVNPSPEKRAAVTAYRSKLDRARIYERHDLGGRLQRALFEYDCLEQARLDDLKPKVVAGRGFDGMPSRRSTARLELVS